MAVKRQLGGVVLALTFSLGIAYAAESPAGPLEPRLGLLKPMSELVGKKVSDAKEHGLGKAEDILLDLAKGQAAVVLVSPKGDPRLVPVPARSFGYVSKGSIVLRVDRKLLENAPRLARSGQGTTCDEQTLNAAAAHFGQPAPDLQGGGPGVLTSGAALLHRRVVSQNNESLGQIKELMVDLPTGAVTYGVVEPAADLSASGLLYVVPPTALQVTAPGQALVLKAERSHFLAGPRFSKEFWTDLSFPEMAAKVRTHYSLAARATPGAAASAAQPNSAHSDSVLAEAVMSEIFNEAKGTLRLNVLVSSRDGKVTLRGSVKDQKQKARVVAAAERIAGTQNVEDLLETNQKNTTAKL